MDNEVQIHDVGVNRLGIAEYFTQVLSAWFLTSHVLSELNTGPATKFSNFFNKIIDELNCKLNHENTSSTLREALVML